MSYRLAFHSGIPYIYSLKELNPRRRVYVEIPKPARVELKCSQNLLKDHLIELR
jgi:hypothetical protein